MTCARLTGLAWMAYWAALTPLVVVIEAVKESGRVDDRHRRQAG